MIDTKQLHTANPTMMLSAAERWARSIRYHHSHEARHCEAYSIREADRYREAGSREAAPIAREADRSCEAGSCEAAPIAREADRSREAGSREAAPSTHEADITCEASYIPREASYISHEATNVPREASQPDSSSREAKTREAPDDNTLAPVSTQDVDAPTPTWTCWAWEFPIEE